MKSAAALILALVLFLSCDDGTAPPRVHHTSCDDAPGITHTGSIGSGRWKAADGPHRIHGRVTFATLVVEPGTLVCAGPEATLEGDDGVKLTAIGTAAAPIVFTAEDPAAPWGGMALHDPAAGELSQLHHVVVRNLSGGIDASNLDLRQSRVENACQQGGTCAAVAGGHLHLEDVVIDRSGALGVAVGRRTSVTLIRTRIQNSAGVGLDVSAGDSDVHLTVAGLRIVGGETYPARIGDWQLEQLAGSRAAVDSLMGNASDTLLIGVIADSVEAPMTVYRDLHWRLVQTAYTGNPSRLTIPDLALEAGASVSFAHHEIVLRVRRLQAVGTAEDPVVIEGGDLTVGAPDTDAASDTVRLAHARLVRLRVGSEWEGGAVALALDSVQATRSELAISEGSRATFRSATLDSSTVVVNAADVLFEDVDFLRSGNYFYGSDAPGVAAPALTVSSGSVAVSDCEIRDGTSDGVRLGETAAAGTSINNCNLVSNAGFGVNNLSPFTVDAAGNWWGDPVGPDGPNGDGVSGDVVVEPLREEPVQH